MRASSASQNLRTNSAINPMQQVMDYVGEHPVSTLSVSVFPAAQRTSFDYYDDDGETYAYQHGAYVQRITIQSSGHTTSIETAAPPGPEPHGPAPEPQRLLGDGGGRLGGVTYLKVRVDAPHALLLRDVR